MPWRKQKRGAEPWKTPQLRAQVYACDAGAMLLGLVLDYVGFNAVKMLFWWAVLDGVLAPPLIVSWSC